MARPTKQGLDYFPLDVDWDRETKLLIVEFGSDVIAIMVTIFQYAYKDEGYYLEWDDDTKLIIGDEIKIQSVEKLDCVLSKAIERGIFSKNMFDKYKILTSKRLQNSYFTAAKSKKFAWYNNNFLLVDVSSYKNAINLDGNGVNLDRNATNVDVEEEVKEEVDVKGKGNSTEISKSETPSPTTPLDVNKETNTNEKTTTFVQMGFINFFVDAWNRHNPDNQIKIRSKKLLDAVKRIHQNNKSIIHKMNTGDVDQKVENYKRSIAGDGKPHPDHGWYSPNNFLDNIDMYWDGPIDESKNKAKTTNATTGLSPEVKKEPREIDEITEIALAVLEKKSKDGRFWCESYISGADVPEKFRQRLEKEKKIIDQNLQKQEA